MESERNNNSNQAAICGVIRKPFMYSHQVYGECFYTTEIEVERLSGCMDVILVIISDRLIDPNKEYIGYAVKFTGEFRSYNEYREEGNRLCLFLFAKKVHIYRYHSESFMPYNRIILQGYLCKEPIYRETPLGREITDLLLAVNRPYGKSDYIPCICWGRNARYASKLQVGDAVYLNGRIQNREYVKNMEGGSKRRLAYEVSASSICCMYDRNRGDMG